MSCSETPPNIPMGCGNVTPVKMALVSKEQTLEIEKAYARGDQVAFRSLLEIAFSQEYSPNVVLTNKKDQEVFDDTIEQAKRAIEYYQDFEPPEYNQTKYIRSKANAKPLFNGKSTKLARNNIKQKQK